MTQKEKLLERWNERRITESMLRVYVTKGLISSTDFQEITGNEPTIDAEKQFENAKNSKVNESKAALSTYLATHPMLWSDGKYYSVTSEKQSLLTSNLALYQLAAASGQPFTLKWNTTGDECTEWKYEELAALALAIGAYVQPFVSYQQEVELKIKACTSMDELNLIEINYDSVKQVMTDDNNAA